MARDPTQKEVALLIRPVLMGGVLKTDDATIPPKRLRLERTRMQAHPAEAALIAQLAEGRITLEQLAAELSVGEPVSWEFSVRQAGCAGVALSKRRNSS